MYVGANVINNFKMREKEIYDKIIQSGISYKTIGVFGSYARNEYKSTSDIDMCIIVNTLPSREQKGMLYCDAEEANVDLIFVTQEYFENDTSLFAKNLRRDFREIKYEY